MKTTNRFLLIALIAAAALGMALNASALMISYDFNGPEFSGAATPQGTGPWLNVKIDEYYLGRVDLEQVATADHKGRDLDLRVSKIYPQVNDGQFEVDMTLAEEPDGLRRGQTMQIRLTLGDNSDAVLIPNGSFYQETGGNWVFVVSADGGEAVKRTVRLGRRNTEFIEVLDGLEPGEKVITSPYTSFTDMDRLTLDGE